MYSSSFKPSSRAESVMINGNILGDRESPADMVERVVETIVAKDLHYSNNLEQSTAFGNALGEAMDIGAIVMSTPVLTNAGRYADRPLTACTVPTAALRHGNEHLISQDIKTLHEQGMGTGFNLDDLEEPVEMLRFLNKVAIESATSGKEDRPVGNMAVLTVYHPKIRDFINAKTDTNEQWKFNLSVDIDEHFMAAVASDAPIELHNGTIVSSQALFSEICQAATVSGDPGLIFLDRMNQRNPIPGLGEYRTTAPCAEVGLLEGETCQFGYINLAKFIIIGQDGPSVDSAKLEGVSYLMTRALDNTLDVSRDHFSTDRSRYVLDQKRKIGIGICGVADALTLARLPYDSPEGRQMIQDMLATINFSSKEESVRLAEQRGSCNSMLDIINNRYLQSESQLERLYSQHSTANVSSDDWIKLAKKIRDDGTLRNITTIALPPTGRSALVIDASTGIEPHFTLDALHPDVQDVVDELRSNPEAEDILRTATSIPPLGHIAMAATLQRFSDESLSKTVNLPAGSSSTDVADMYRKAHDSGMSGVTIYIDGTHTLQPKSLK